MTGAAVYACALWSDTFDWHKCLGFQAVTAVYLAALCPPLRMLMVRTFPSALWAGHLLSLTSGFCVTVSSTCHCFCTLQWVLSSTCHCLCTLQWVLSSTCHCLCTLQWVLSSRCHCLCTLQWVLCRCVVYLPLPLHTAVGSVSVCHLLAITLCT